ncbi:MAG TPA: hypothetical protein VEY71_02465 [Chitinophagales bacterium]|nr:hypothetical protein [Chitinophagales bacterium]
MTDKGPNVDKSRMLSGNLANQPIPPFDTNMVRSQYWVPMGGDGTAYVGPWGISFAASLTPDSITGIGASTEEQFTKTLRTGKHLGLDGGRDILPRMPRNVYNKLDDEDLASIFAYLKSWKPVRNKVRTPVPPHEIGRAQLVAVTP